MDIKGAENWTKTDQDFSVLTYFGRFGIQMDIPCIQKDIKWFLKGLFSINDATKHPIGISSGRSKTWIEVNKS